MIHFTELERLPIYDLKGHYIGRIEDMGIVPSQNPLQVAFYIVRTHDKQLLAINGEQLQSISVRAAQITVTRDAIQLHAPDESHLCIKNDVLDQQIIDVNHQKVVRVNDVDFDIEPAEGHIRLRIVAVNVGWGAAIRRLLQGMIPKHQIRTLANLFPSKAIPWEFVNLIEPDPARRVKLRISYNRLAELHPADLADILEELSHDEQKSVIESLDDETAAQAMSEISTKLQVALLESIPAERAADIVEEMPPDEAADVLQELPPETSAEVLSKMESEEAQDVRELLMFEENTAGGMMTNEYLMVGDSATVEGAIMALKIFEGNLDLVHSVYMIDEDCVLTGAVPLSHILLAEPSTPLRELASDPLISAPSHADEKTVIGLFHKYNLLTLPVVDEKDRILGVVTADDVLDVLVNGN